MPRVIKSQQARIIGSISANNKSRCFIVIDSNSCETSIDGKEIFILEIVDMLYVCRK